MLHRATYLLVLLGMCVLVQPAIGQSPNRTYLVGGDLEQEALGAATAKKYIKARELATKALKANPDSFLGNWVMALVFHYEEANNPRALYMLRKAKSMLLEREGDPPKNFDAIDWYLRILKEEQYLLGEMGRTTEKIALIDYHDEHFKPSWKRRKMWPLMQERRFDEARALGKELILSQNINERITGYNGLQALESEAIRPMESWRWVQEGLKNTQYRSCILFFNGSSTAWQALMFPEAEALARKAQHAQIRDCGTSHYYRLVSLYTIMGRFQEALSAFKELRKAPVRKEERQQVEKRILGRLKSLMMPLGQFKEAERLARDIYKFPDRDGTWSTSKDQSLLSASFSYYSASTMVARRQEERASVRDPSLLDRARFTARSMAKKPHTWNLKRVAIRSMAKKDYLVHQFLPFQGQSNLWEFDFLLEIAGLGVARASLERAKSRKIHPEERARGFYDAMEGWLEFRAGNWGKAEALGANALQHLPKELILLNSMVRMWVGHIRWKRGDIKKATRDFHSVLNRFPTAFRFLNLSLPVRFTHDSSDLAKEAVARLKNSPRFREEDSQFVVHAQTRRGHLEVCLRSTLGGEYNCTNEKTSGDDFEIAQLLDLFQDRSFSPKVELTQSDINSLDGRTGRVDSDILLQQILEKSKETK